MLILARKQDESLVIQDEIVITVLAIEGDKVKLGIRAPRSVPVLRMELWQAIQEQSEIAGRLAAQPDAPGFEVLRAFLNEQETGT